MAGSLDLIDRGCAIVLSFWTMHFYPNSCNKTLLCGCGDKTWNYSAQYSFHEKSSLSTTYNDAFNFTQWTQWRQHWHEDVPYTFSVFQNLSSRQANLPYEHSDTLVVFVAQIPDKNKATSYVSLDAIGCGSYHQTEKAKGLVLLCVDLKWLLVVSLSDRERFRREQRRMT